MAKRKTHILQALMIGIRLVVLVFLSVFCSAQNLFSQPFGNSVPVQNKFHPPGQQTDRGIELKLMLVNATLELNEAMLEGVKASIDTLNLPENTIAPKSTDLQTSILRMKRARDKALLMPYLLHVQDSLSNEITLLKAEQKTLKSMVNDIEKAQTVVVKSQILTSGKDSLKLETSYNPKNGGKETIIQNLKTNEVIVMNDDMSKSERKRNEKKLKKYKDMLPKDTVLVYDIGSSLTPEPEVLSQTSINYSSKNIDTATIQQIMEDTTSVIIIRSPESNDSIVIKPRKRKLLRNETTASEKIAEHPKETNRNKKADTDSLAKIKAEFFLKRALRSIDVKDLKQANTYLHKAIAIYPNYYDAWYAMAEMDKNNQIDSKALKEYERCAKIDSSHPILFYKIGLIYMKTNRKKEAFENFDKTIQLDPSYIDALMQRASILTEWNKINEAILDYDQVTKTDKTYYKAYKARGIAKMSFKFYNEAADDFTRFLIFEPEDAESYYYRGVCRIGNSELLDGCLDLSTALEKGYTAAEKAIRESCN